MGSLKAGPVFYSFLSSQGQSQCLAQSRCLVNSVWIEIKPHENKADIFRWFGLWTTGENLGLQVGKESGICSRSRYWSDDRLSPKARGGEGRGLWFLQCLLGCVGSLCWQQRWGGEVGSSSGGLGREFRMEQMSQRKGSNSDGDGTRLKSPSLSLHPPEQMWQFCVCMCACALVHACTCVCWKENRLYSQINLCAYPSVQSQGLWDLEYVLFFFLNLHFPILKKWDQWFLAPAWLWLCSVFCKQ